jgi:putative nucleotidyltransferase with HDIG domain
MEPVVTEMNPDSVVALSALAASAEAREPSAAGHQHRVAEIATAIALELDLDESVVAGIRIAGQLHDIGKASIPANVLRQTGRVDFSDWELIKTHCQAGFEIVAGISFEWPVAEMVLQHHERLDGSGYPAGLRGDEILLGARIIAVADTVEDEMSISSDDPETGVDAALEKITAGRGRLFDLHVVDACRHLFRENPQFGR